MAMDTQDYVFAARDQLYPQFANYLRSGEGTLSDRVDLSANNIAQTSQALLLSYFTAFKSELINNIALYSGAAAAATMTLIRAGVYSVDSLGNLNLIASTPNDATLLASANTRYLKALSVPFQKIRGQRYAFAVLQVGTTPAQLNGTLVGATISSQNPRITGVVPTQADLPTSVAVGSLQVSSTFIYGELTP